MNDTNNDDILFYSVFPDLPENPVSVGGVGTPKLSESVDIMSTSTKLSLAALLSTPTATSV